MKAFVLLLLLWNNATGGSRSEVVSAEYSSQATCEAAAAQAKKTFQGYGVSVYAVCSEK